MGLRVHLHLDDLLVAEGAQVVHQALREARFALLVGAPKGLGYPAAVIGCYRLMPTALAFETRPPASPGKGYSMECNAPPQLVELLVVGMSASRLQSRNQV